MGLVSLSCNMVSKAAAVLLSLTPIAAAWPWGKSGAWCLDGTPSINYTSVPGFFQQDDPATDPATFDYVRIELTGNPFGGGSKRLTMMA